MKKSSIVTNYIYNAFFQILSIITPIITAPYIARTLGATNLGIYNYTYSIVYWFIIFGMMGVGIYGNKEMAKLSNNRAELSKCFWEIFFLQLLSTVTVCIIFFIFFAIGDHQYKTIFLVQGGLIIAGVFNITWFYSGLESFKKITIRDSVIKLLTIICLFVFIKNDSDLNIYTWMLLILNFLSQFSLWFGLNKVVDFKMPTIKGIFSHFKENILLFIPQIAISIYGIFDQTMIGMLYNDVSEVAFYNQAHRLVNMFLFLVTTIGTVMLPRAVASKSTGDISKIKDMTNKTFKIALFLSLPIAVGMSTIAPYFIPWFLTENFVRVSYIIPILCPTIVLIALTNVIGVQFLIVFDETKKYTISVTISCFVNLFLNILLIPRFGALGASFASVITELSVLIIQCYFVKGRFNFDGVIQKLLRYATASLLMGGIIIFIGQLMGTGIFTNILQFLLGGFVYLAIVYILKDDVLIFLIEKLKGLLPFGNK